MAVELHQASIVFLGNFNPVIFQPKWLQEIDILPASEFQNIEKPGNIVVSSDWTVVQLMALRFEVLRERWTLVTERPDWVADLGSTARAIFKRLPETPVTRVGFNDVRHRRVNGDVDARMRKWVPIDEFGKVAGESAALGGTARATWNNYQTVLQLEKSVQVASALYIFQNFEREATAKDLQTRLLDWPSVVQRAEQVVSTFTT